MLLFLRTLFCLLVLTLPLPLFLRLSMSLSRRRIAGRALVLSGSRRGQGHLVIRSLLLLLILFFIGAVVPTRAKRLLEAHRDLVQVLEERLLLRWSNLPTLTLGLQHLLDLLFAPPFAQDAIR